MAQRRDATTAYAQPAESLYRAEPKRPVQVEVKAARPLWFTMGENVGAGLGAFLISHYAVGLDPVTARGIGATLAGTLMVLRYALDEPSDLIRRWSAERAANAGTGEIKRLRELCATLEDECERWQSAARELHQIAEAYSQEIADLRDELDANSNVITIDGGTERERVIPRNGELEALAASFIKSLFDRGALNPAVVLGPESKSPRKINMALPFSDTMKKGQQANDLYKFLARRRLIEKIEYGCAYIGPDDMREALAQVRS